MELDLEQARRRAKERLRAARRGEMVLREDREPRLADAQRSVANELGFPSWPALVAHARRPAGTGRSARARLVARGAGRARGPCGGGCSPPTRRWRAPGSTWRWCSATPRRWPPRSRADPGLVSARAARPRPEAAVVRVPLRVPRARTSRARPASGAWSSCCSTRAPTRTRRSTTSTARCRCSTARPAWRTTRRRRGCCSTAARTPTTASPSTTPSRRRTPPAWSCCSSAARRCGTRTRSATRSGGRRWCGCCSSAATCARRTPSCATRCCGRAGTRTARLLIEHGADLEARDRDGLTPYSNAARRGDESLMAVLAEAGARHGRRPGGGVARPLVRGEAGRAGRPARCCAAPTPSCCRCSPARATTTSSSGCSTPASRCTRAASTRAPRCTTRACGAGGARSSCCWPAAPSRT